MFTTSNRPRSSTGQRLAVGTLVLSALLIAATGCSADPEATGITATSHDHSGSGAWQALHLEVNEVEHYDSLAELGAAADLIIEGRPERIDGVRRVGGPGSHGIDLAQIVFDVRSAHSSDLPDAPTEITVEFAVPPGSGIEALEASLVDAPAAVIALREKGGAEAGRFRLINQGALWTMSDDQVISGLEGSTVSANAARPAPRNLTELTNELLVDIE